MRAGGPGDGGRLDGAAGGAVERRGGAGGGLLVWPGGRFTPQGGFIAQLPEVRGVFHAPGDVGGDVAGPVVVIGSGGRGERFAPVVADARDRRDLVRQAEVLVERIDDVLVMPAAVHEVVGVDDFEV